MKLIINSSSALFIRDISVIEIPPTNHRVSNKVNDPMFFFKKNSSGILFAILQVLSYSSHERLNILLHTQVKF